MSKSKAGKQSKVNAAKPAEPVSTGAHLDAPSGADHPGADKASGVTKADTKEAGKFKPGTVALVSKGAERIPVQLKDEAHLARLRAEFGDTAVEVQS